MYETKTNRRSKTPRQHHSVRCSNCNEHGHMYKECTEPVISIGIAAFRSSVEDRRFYDDKFEMLMRGMSSNRMAVTESPLRDIYVPTGVRVLCIRKRETFEYTDFVRGKYTLPKNEASIVKMLSAMTRCEVARVIGTRRFEEIWDGFWVNHQCRFYKNDYAYAERIYRRNIEYIRSAYSRFKAQIDATCPVYPEWELPKGRRNTNEGDFSCAAREFSEETGYTDRDFTVPNDRTVEEPYLGMNNVNYMYRYYAAEMSNECGPPIVSSKSQKSEISDIGWFTVSQIMSLFAPRYIRKKEAVLRCMLNIYAKDVIV